MEAKRGSAHWLQQWFHHPHLELVVGMTAEESSEEDVLPMPPEETETSSEVVDEPPEDTGATSSDTEDDESMERMMAFAREFLESVPA